MLSGYKIMWLLVMYDLPVFTKQQRKEATKFRVELLKQGFEMEQFSIYTRHCPSKEAANKYHPKIRNMLPQGGLVQILLITDIQYENIVTYSQNETVDPKKREQLVLL